MNHLFIFFFFLRESCEIVKNVFPFYLTEEGGRGDGGGRKRRKPAEMNELSSMQWLEHLTMGTPQTHITSGEQSKLNETQLD